MRGRVRAWAGALVCGVGSLLAAASSAVAQTTYRSDSLGVSVRLPAGWMIVPDSILRVYERRFGVDTRSEAAFQPARARGWFDFPYVLVEFIRGTPDPPAELAEALRSSSAAARAPGAARTREVIHDRRRDVVLFRTSIPDDNGPELETEGALRMTAGGCLGIRVTGLESDSLRMLALRDSLVERLSVDDSVTYRPEAPALPIGEGVRREGGAWGLQLLGVAVCFGLSLAVLGLLALAGRPRAQADHGACRLASVPAARYIDGGGGPP